MEALGELKEHFSLVLVTQFLDQHLKHSNPYPVVSISLRELGGAFRVTSQCFNRQSKLEAKRLNAASQSHGQQDYAGNCRLLTLTLAPLLHHTDKTWCYWKQWRAKTFCIPFITIGISVRKGWEGSQVKKAAHESSI